jgi:hypothetical protein
MRPMPSLPVSSTRAWLISSACWRDSSAQGPAISASGRSLPRVKEPIETERGAGMGVVLAGARDCGESNKGTFAIARRDFLIVDNGLAIVRRAALRAAAMTVHVAKSEEFATLISSTLFQPDGRAVCFW